MPLAPLDPADYRDLVRRALQEDVGDADVTTGAIVPVDAQARGIFLAKTDLVVAGLDIAAEVFGQVDGRTRLEILTPEGDTCRAGGTLAAVSGPARALLTGERTALNFLQRLSGIATLTRRYVAAAGGTIVVLDTRKTTPTLRALEKYAVRAGGGTNHRVGLFDAVLVKDNHVRLAGGVAAAVTRVRAARPDLPIEVEAQSLEEVQAAVEASADTILLDNLSLEDIASAVRLVAGRARVEISGGVTLDRLAGLAQTGADSVSIGALTHSAPAADISFEIVG